MLKTYDIIRCAVAMMLVLLATACSISSYEDGDGDNSYIRADFALVNTDNNAKLTSFDTDDGESFSFVEPKTVEGAKADTTYRAIVYYDRKDGSNVVFRGLEQVGVLNPKPLKTGEQYLYDPLHWESMWTSKNGTYVNLGLKIMVGAVDDKGKKQTLQLIREKKEGNLHYLRLSHSQNGVPEYYSQKVYLSIPVKDNFAHGDEVTISINTYDGLSEKTVIVP